MISSASDNGPQTTLTGGDRAAAASSSFSGSNSRLSAVVKGPAATITDSGAAPACAGVLLSRHRCCVWGSCKVWQCIPFPTVSFLSHAFSLMMLASRFCQKQCGARLHAASRKNSEAEARDAPVAAAKVANCGAGLAAIGAAAAVRTAVASSRPPVGLVAVTAMTCPGNRRKDGICAT